MTTVTVAQIAQKIAEVIAALTPTSFTTNNAAFVENPTPNTPLRSWARLSDRDRVTRLFEVYAVGNRTSLGLTSRAEFVEQLFRVTIAYPTDHHTIFGIATRRGLEDAIAADAVQIQNALRGGGGLVGPGHQALKLSPGVKEPDRGNVAVWFQEIDMLAQFWAAV